MKKNNKVVKAGAGYVIGNYMLKGLTFLSIPVFSRLMSTNEYGLYNMFIAYESIIYIFMGFAIHSSYKNARYRYSVGSGRRIPGETYARYVSTTMVLLIINALIWLICIFSFLDQLVLILGLSKMSLLLLVIHSFGTAVIICFNTYTALEYQYRIFVKISGINAISSMLISIILMYTLFSEQRYIARIVGSTIPIFIIAIVIIVKFWRVAKPGNYREFLGWGIKYSCPIVPHGISQVILSQFDRIMINKMIGSSFAGIYSFAYNIYAIVAVTANSLDNVWSTWFYEAMHHGNMDSIKNKSKIYMLMMMILSIVIILISPEIVKALGGKEYWSASYSVIPLVASGYFSFLYTIPASIEYYYEKTKFIAFGTGMASIINIVLNFAFISKFGYIIAAYTTLFTYILYFIFHYFLAVRIHGKSAFSTKTIIFCSVTVLIVTIVSRLLINKCFLRWMAVSVIMIMMIIHMERSNHILRLIIRKIKNGKE